MDCLWQLICIVELGRVEQTLLELSKSIVSEPYRFGCILEEIKRLLEKSTKHSPAVIY